MKQLAAAGRGGASPAGLFGRSCALLFGVTATALKRVARAFLSFSSAERSPNSPSLVYPHAGSVEERPAPDDAGLAKATKRSQAALAPLHYGVSAARLTNVAAPTGFAGAIWQRAQELSADDLGYICTVTGNGDYGVGLSSSNYGDSMLKLSPPAATDKSASHEMRVSCRSQATSQVWLRFPPQVA